MFPKIIQVSFFLRGGGARHIYRGRGLIFGMLIGLHIWGAYTFLGGALIYGGRINKILWYITRVFFKIMLKLVSIKRT